MNHISGNSGPSTPARHPERAALADAPPSARDIPGFGPLTPIETDFGHVPAQALRLRDRVRLRSGRYCPIAWIDRLLLDEHFLVRNQEAQPVLVAPGKLGFGLPSGPVLLAPGQRLSGGQGYAPLFRTAHDLLQAGMAYRRPETFLTYVTFGFAEPEDVCAGGLWLHVPPPAPKNPHDDEA